MSQPKDYDTTLARIAGNIASGMNASNYDADAIAERAVKIAERIVAECRLRWKKAGE